MITTKENISIKDDIYKKMYKDYEQQSIKINTKIAELKSKIKNSNPFMSRSDELQLHKICVYEGIYRDLIYTMNMIKKYAHIN